MRTVLIAVEMLAASTRVGSLVCLALVSSVAREVIDPTSRIELFRGIGRLYGIVGTGALIVADRRVGRISARRPSRRVEPANLQLVPSHAASSSVD
jgi:hypothetical protein